MNCGTQPISACISAVMSRRRRPIRDSRVMEFLFGLYAKRTGQTTTCGGISGCQPGVLCDNGVISSWIRDLVLYGAIGRRRNICVASFRFTSWPTGICFIPLRWWRRKGGIRTELAVGGHRNSLCRSLSSTPVIIVYQHLIGNRGSAYCAVSRWTIEFQEKSAISIDIDWTISTVYWL